MLLVCGCGCVLSPVSFLEEDIFLLPLQLASTAIGIQTPEGIVLASERRLTSPLMVSTNTEKIMEIDSHLGEHFSWKLVFSISCDNGVYSSLFRGKASGGHSKARETRDAQFLQKVAWFALIGAGPARPRPCKCPPPQIPVSQSPF